MSDLPLWIRELSEPDLVELFGFDTVVRGRAYAQQGRVGAVTVAGNLITARVRGASWAQYHALVAPEQRGVLPLRTSCTCPVRQDCKHVVALLVHVRAASEREDTPSWRRALDPLLARVEAVDGGLPLGLQVNESVQGLTLRPLREGQHGKWVKSGATWEELRYRVPHQLDRRHVELARALLSCRERPDYAYHQRVETLPLVDLRPEFWSILAGALEAGVVLVAGEDAAHRRLGVPRLLSQPVEPRLHLSPIDGALHVSPVLRIADADRAEGAPDVAPRGSGTLTGRPPHGVAVAHEGTLWIGPLARPLTLEEERLFRSGTVSVPESDIALFTAAFLPQLRQRLSVTLADGLDLPERDAPQLLCRVAFGAVSAHVTWGVRYVIGDSVHDLPVVPRPGEPPLRDAAAEAALAASVPEGPWQTPGRHGLTLVPVTLTGRPLFGFVSDTLPVLEARPDVIVDLDAPAPSFTEATEAPRVAVRVSDPTDGDWFSLGVTVSVAGEDVPLPLLLAALTAEDDHVVLESGTWFALDAAELDPLRALVVEARDLADPVSGDLRLRPEHAGLWGELVTLGVVAAQSVQWREAVSALLDTESLPEVATPHGLLAELRPYQRSGLSWLRFLARTRLGGILADEMGLGKTLQALASVQAGVEAGDADGPTLVIAPTSVLGTWASEAARFTPDLRVVTLTQTAAKRGASLTESIAGADIVLTTYTLVRLDADAYAEQRWGTVLLDEAQFVKNHTSQAYKAVRRLRARSKVALTGTPLENNLMELWSILSIVAPGLFPDPKRFTETFRTPIERGDAAALARLHRRIRPLVLRRTKAAVAEELPDKIEQIVGVELSPAHRRLYDRHLTRERQRVLGLVSDLSRNRIAILRSLTLLRQLSLSPVLVDAAAPATSAKIDVLVAMVTELIAEGHRALVFSQFTGFLKLVRERLAAEHIEHEYLDGRTRDRAARIESFRTGTAPVFLISLKAGGFGLTLTEADYVFILDPWWNPAAETQAIDRTHRIGQDKPVNVYRLVATDTIEEKVVALQAHKRDLFTAVVGQASDIAAPLDADAIRGLLDAS